jgi:sugar O-acyltransferase (sialic acid O-acetyltransferase NeuD family)
MKKIAIFGAGGFGREVKWLIDELNKTSPQWDFIGYFDDDFTHVSKIDASLFLGGQHELNQWKEELAIVFAIGNPIVKRNVISGVDNPFLYFPVLIHPSVRMGTSVELGGGCIICAGNILTVDIKIGRHVILNLNCTVGHDAEIGDYSSFMPTVNISGEVITGECVYAGTGASIINRIRIGAETIIGAGAVVTRDLPSNCTAVGVPAKIIKRI